MELFRLLGTIAINDKEAKSAIDGVTGEASAASGKMQQFFGKMGTAAIKVAKVAGAAAIAGTAAITKASVDSYAQYEQLVGGVETLFKDSSGKVMEYAQNAYKTAGLSANEYMETVTSFSASLLQSLGGDTEKAAEYADTAIRDMSDNANKMGTDMTMIQNAYQGFAKQNYTMLDNLKLGYGGTKEEMQRLLSDAEKLSGQKFDISSYADIVDAIHVVQTEMGITGTTAKEAATTIEGSANSMKASWQNLLTGFADSNQDLQALLGQFIDSVITYGSNLIPRIGIILQNIASLFVSNIPAMLNVIMQGISQGIPNIAAKLGEMFGNIGNEIKSKLPTIMSNALDVISNLASTLRQNAPALIQSGLDMIVNIAKGLMNSLPVLISKVPTIVSDIANIINDNAPKLLVTAGRLILTLAIGLIQAIPTLVQNLPKIIKAIVDVFMAFQWTALGKNIIKSLKNGIVAMKSQISSAGKSIMDAAVNKIKQLPKALYNLAKQAVQKMVNIFRHTAKISDAVNAIKNEIVHVLKQVPAKMLSIGSNIVKGVWNGISGAAGWLYGKVKSFATGVIDKMKSALGIHSPSMVAEEQVGKNVALGVANGIHKNKKYAKKKAAELAQVIVDAAKERLDRYQTYNNMTLAAEVAFWDTIRKQCKKGTAARLEADKEYIDKKKELNEQLKQLEDDYIAKIETANQKIADRANSLLNAFNLFDEFAIKIDEDNPLTGETLINNLESQVNALTDWTSQMASLGNKIGNTELYKALQDMGISSLQQVQLINQMSEAELNKYVELYNQRAEIAKKQAESELGTEVMNEMMEAYKSYEEAVSGLGATVNEKYSEIGKIIEAVLTKADQVTNIKVDNMADLMKNGVKEMSNDTKSAFESIVGSISSSMDSAVSRVASAVASMKAMLASVSGSGVGAGVSVATASVRANAKGGILKKPTIFGYTPSTNTYQLGGEAGAEAIAPISTLKQYVAEAVASQNGELVGVLKSILSAIKEQSLSVSLDGKEIANSVNRRLGVIY